MRIEKVEKEVKKVDFASLKVGDCYLDSGNKLCMKIETCHGGFGEDYAGEYDSIRLEDGLLSSDWGKVTLVEASLQYYIK